MCVHGKSLNVVTDSSQNLFCMNYVVHLRTLRALLLLTGALSFITVYIHFESTLISFTLYVLILFLSYVLLILIQVLISELDNSVILKSPA